MCPSLDNRGSKLRPKTKQNRLALTADADELATARQLDATTTTTAASSTTPPRKHASWAPSIPRSPSPTRYRTKAPSSTLYHREEICSVTHRYTQYVRRVRAYREVRRHREPCVSHNHPNNEHGGRVAATPTLTSPPPHSPSSCAEQWFLRRRRYIATRLRL